MKPTALVHIIVLSYGWRRWLIAFAAGALSAAAMAPLGFWPILFLTFPVLVWLIDGAGAGEWRGLTGAAATGWWFGFGYFLAGLYWVGFAFLVDAPTFGWLLPIAVIGLPAGLAIFTAFGVALARLLVDARRVAHAGARGRADRRGMVARTPADRISVERLRLRTDLAAHFGAERRADRHLGPDIPGGRDLRQPGDAVRRP